MGDPWRPQGSPASLGALASHLSWPYSELQAEGISELLCWELGTFTSEVTWVMRTTGPLWGFPGGTARGSGKCGLLTFGLFAPPPPRKYDSICTDTPVFRPFESSMPVSPILPLPALLSSLKSSATWSVPTALITQAQPAMIQAHQQGASWYLPRSWACSSFCWPVPPPPLLWPTLLHPVE